jgi:ABC-type multidrug transport system permease subunit
MFSGIGLLMATRAQTLETISGLMNLFMLPMWITSGIFFSVERFPEAVQPYLRLLPLTPLIDAIRSVMLEGAHLSSLGWELASMLIWSVISFTLALKFFRWG